MRKRLLLLGGTSISRQIVYAAHELNYDVFVTDYLEDSPCKKIAEKSFMVSCTDVDEVVRLIKNEHIDGVIMGYADVLMPSYVQICEKAGLPCYASSHAVEVTTDKADFKRLCREFDIPVVPEYSVQDVKDNNAVYPLIVKPVDNSGARGIYICHNEDEFDRFYHQAMSYSRKGEVLIERFMDEKEVTVFYYLHEEVVYMLGTGDRLMLRFDNRLLQLPVGYIFPSLNECRFLEEEDGNIRRMFHSLDMREGMVFMQCFNENGKYTVYEMGYRLTGSIEHHLMEHAYGFNHLKAILRYAVGDEVDTSPMNPPVRRDMAMANLTLLLSEGTISHYEGLDEVQNMPGVLHVHESYPIGKTIDSSVMGKLAQVGMRVLLYADDKGQLLSRMDTIKDRLRVISTDGMDMVLRNYSYREMAL